MIPYTKKILPNGLTVVVNRDRASKLAAVNILYKVGARNEDPRRTGFAHLFEHLMFRGTREIPNFDLPVQMASGDNNAFTNNDYTDFYITLPKDNLETALWLESDRMEGLDITPAKLEAEKKVVIEEFRQRYLNQPYGDQTMLLRALAYKVHPYRWAAIGLTTDHIAEATLEDVEAFYRTHYRPSNAVLSISADIEEERMLELAEKWFAPLADRPADAAPIPQEPAQTEARREEVERDVPAPTVTVAYHMGGRTDAGFYTADLVSDLLAGGDSGRLYTHLVKERRLLSSVNAYVTGDVDPGLFVFTGQLLPGVTPKEAEAAFREDSFHFIPGKLGPAMAEAKGVLARTGNPQLADFALDKAYYEDLKALADAVSSPFVKGYVTTLIDSANLRAAVRCVRMGKDAEFLRGALVAGGNVPVQRLVQAVFSGEGIAAAFASTPFSDAAALGAAAIEGGTMTEFERECDNAVNRYMTGAHLKSFGPEQVVGYLTAEEGNTMAVRMVLTGLLAGIDPERLQERLRESYV